MEWKLRPRNSVHSAGWSSMEIERLFGSSLNGIGKINTLDFEGEIERLLLIEIII